MKYISRYLSVVIGSLLIAVSFNLFIAPNHFIEFGALGISSILNYTRNTNIALNLIIINLIVLLIGLLFFDLKKISKYIIPSLLIPLFIFITSDINTIIDFKVTETMLSVIAGSFMSGYGYSIIYKEGYNAGVTFLLEEIIGYKTKFYSKLYSWFFDLLIIIVYFVLFGLEMTLYSIIIIFITKYMITKARFGISDSKMFYIITSKEKEVRDYIIHDLKYELTVLDVKGGFTKKKNKIFLSIISTSDYYKLKEGIKVIDPKAFIAITDTYDVVNKHTV